MPFRACSNFLVLNCVHHWRVLAITCDVAFLVEFWTMKTFLKVMSFAFVTHQFVSRIYLLLGHDGSWGYCVHLFCSLFLLLSLVPIIKLSLVVIIDLRGFHLGYHCSLFLFVLCKLKCEVFWTMVSSRYWWEEHSFYLRCQTPNVAFDLLTLRAHHGWKKKRKVFEPSGVWFDIWTFHFYVPELVL